VGGSQINQTDTKELNQMRSTRRKMLPVLLAVLALGAVAASAAQASTEGPFYKSETSKGVLTRLVSGKSLEVKAKAGKFVGMYVGGFGTSFECSSENTKVFASGAKLLGSTGANLGSGEATIELTCYVSEQECGKATITTVPLKMELDYLSSTRTGHIAAVFKPVKEFSNFGEVVFSGCFKGPWEMRGTLVGEIEVGGKPVVVGSEPKVTKTIEINFPLGAITKVWPEVSGSLKETKLSPLTVASFGSEMDGALELELANGDNWGVFTK
jgi:hypothetical protein